MSTGDRWAGARRLFRLPLSRQRVSDAVDAEMRFHLEERIEELVAGGMARDTAELEARERFGNPAAYQRETRAIDHAMLGQRSRAELGDALLRDVRYALRGLVRRPLFTAIVVVTIALGIGANTAIFSFVNAVMLNPIAAPDLDRLVMVYDDLPGINISKAPMSPAEAIDLAKRDDLFEISAGYSGGSRTITGFGEPRHVAVTRTQGRFFDVLGARPMLGRLYPADASEPGSHKVIVLSHSFWQMLTGGDRQVAGKPIELDGEVYQIIGVLPPERSFPRATDLWIPLALTPRILSPEHRKSLYTSFIGRMRTGLTHEQLAEGLRVEIGRWSELMPAHYKVAHRQTLIAEPLVDALAGRLRPVLLVLMGAVSLVLLITCANVAGLQLVRATSRARELAIRAALGAGRWSIVRQLLTESFVLAIAGGALGLLLGLATVRALSSWNAMQFEALREVRLDPLVLAFTAGVTLLAALLFGVIPALRAARVDPQDTLKESARGSSGGRHAQRTLQGSVIVQLALALVLLLGSALTVSSLARLISTDPGFNAERVTTMTVSLSEIRYPNGLSRTQFFESLLERLHGMPGIESVGLALGVPFSGNNNSSPFQIRGMPHEEGTPERHASMRMVSGDYFRAIGVPLLRGHAFAATDLPPAGNGPVRHAAVIDQALAKKYFGDEDPIGRVVNQGPDAVIVGVVGEVRDGELGKEPYPTIYYTQRQYNWISVMSIVVRSALDEKDVVALARTAVTELDRDVPLYDIATMSDRINLSLGTHRLAMTVLTGFALLSLALAALGVYGVISSGVAQRTQEIGIRMALGARPAEVVRMVLRSGLVLATIGAAAGTLAFLGLGRVLTSMLYGVAPNDPRIIAGGVVALGAVAVVACVWPARRAARINPVEALREG